jgi:hypothetical protein
MAQKVLEEEKRPLSSTEIWEIAVNKGNQKLIDSKDKTFCWAYLGSVEKVPNLSDHQHA